MLTVPAVKALANERRLQILAWLKQPRDHFPPQTDGDLVRDGVCGVFIAQKLGVSQPTASEHLRILVHAGLLAVGWLTPSFCAMNTPQTPSRTRSPSVCGGK